MPNEREFITVTSTDVQGRFEVMIDGQAIALAPVTHYSHSDGGTVVRPGADEPRRRFLRRGFINCLEADPLPRLALQAGQEFFSDDLAVFDRINAYLRHLHPVL